MQYLSVAVSCFILISISVQMNAQPEGVTSKEESSQCEERELQGNLLLAKYFFERGDWKEAAAFYESAIHEKVMTVDDYHDLAYAHMQLKQNARARQILKGILEFYPEDQLAWHNISLVYYRMNCSAAAFRCAEQSVALDSTYIKSWILLGAIAVEVGHYDRAWDAFDKLYEYDREKATVLHGWIVEETELRNKPRGEW